MADSFTHAANAHAGHDDQGGHGDHGHVVVSLITLRTILALLMFFTLLTVGLAQAEQFVAHALQVEIPQWINVAIALSIAAVKTTLVVMFFMQLKYDNPMNSAVFIFTLLTVCSFLGFTMLDLGQRGSLERNKGDYIKEGGYGGVQFGTLKGMDMNVSIVEAAVLKAKAAGTYDPSKAHHPHDKHGGGRGLTQVGYVPDEPKKGSSPNASRPVKGVTLPELGGQTTEDGGHGDGHSGDKPAGH